MRPLTTKQIEILKLIVKGNTDGTFLDLDQLREALSYKPSKDALHFSVRYLIEKELIEKKPTEKRRGANRRILAATLYGFDEYKALREEGLV